MNPRPQPRDLKPTPQTSGTCRAVWERPAPTGSLSAVSRHRALARARTCYDHLGGALGVGITEAMTDRALLNWEHGLALSTDGLAWLASLGLTTFRRRGSRGGRRS